MNKTGIVITVVIILVIVGIFLLPKGENQNSTRLDSFAQCLSDSGTKFYGAFWCQHCQNQKALFGGSARLLPYVECSTPNAQGQLQVCIDAGVESYPTWEYPDGSRQTGEVSLSQLAEKTGCQLPDGSGEEVPDQGGASNASTSLPALPTQNATTTGTTTTP